MSAEEGGFEYHNWSFPIRLMRMICDSWLRKTSLVEFVRAQPDLAGKLAAAKNLTTQSDREHISAGIDVRTHDER
jgi:2-oxo-4-hydroxy-4-carboxy--5-ureidoimidazoline (OHCU) decarboxylase